SSVSEERENSNFQGNKELTGLEVCKNFFFIWALCKVVLIKRERNHKLPILP
ncbi:14954_t:CDS:2, partial [Dentiscutata erythropus]